MGPEVRVAPPAPLIITRGVRFIGALARLLCLQDLNLSLELVYQFMHR